MSTLHHVDGRLSTGAGNLDRVLHGGLVDGSAVVVSGPPGAGKSILAQQIAFTNASPERPALLISSLTEPQGKLISHLSGFEFFRPEAVGSTVLPLSLGDLVDGREEDLAAAVDAIVRAAITHDASVVVVDSAKALLEHPDNAVMRRHAYELVARLSHLETLTLLVGEYVAEEIRTRPEFAVADAILQLGNDQESHVDRRSLRVAKMRGSGFVTGRHSLRVSGRGIEVSPRLEGVVAPAQVVVGADRCSTGVDGLDEHIGGGLPTHDASLLMGPSGAGKTAMALHFVAEGIARGERALYIALEEPPGSLLAKARSFGLDLDAAVESGRLVVKHAPVTERDIDVMADRMLSHLEEFAPQRVVVDSLGELAYAARREGRNPGFLWALSNAARSFGASTLFTLEIGALQSSDEVSSFANLFHNVLLLRFVERDSHLGRGLLVMKMRDSAHSTRLLDITLDADGVRCGGALTGVSGLLGFSTLTSH